MGDNQTALQDMTVSAAGAAYQQRWPEIVAKAWLDDAFRARLIADPAAVLAEEGLPAIAGIRVVVDEGSDGVAQMTLPLPAKPAEVDDDDLEAMIKTGLVVTECSATSCCC